jgi:hypothetical protein
MAVTKSVTVVANDTVVTAGAGLTTTIGYGLQTVYSAMALLEITNGATAPTVMGEIEIQISSDNANWYAVNKWYGDAKSNGVGVSQYLYPIAVQYTRFVYGANTGQNVTFRIELLKVDAV